MVGPQEDSHGAGSIKGCARRLLKRCFDQVVEGPYAQDLGYGMLFGRLQYIAHRSDPSSFPHDRPFFNPFEPHALPTLPLFCYHLIPAKATPSRSAGFVIRLILVG